MSSHAAIQLPTGPAHMMGVPSMNKMSPANSTRASGIQAMTSPPVWAGPTSISSTDRPPACTRRMTSARVPATPNPGGRADLSRGRLQVLRALADAAVINAPGQGGQCAVDWLDIADPNPALGGLLTATPTRHQQPDSFAFNGGEGIWQQRGIVYFSTKGDRRIWALDIAAQRLQVIYDDFTFASPPLTSVDNLVMSPGGDLIVVEDQDREQSAVAITPDGRYQALVQLGASHAGSEVTGPAFSPDGRHFYFSSQRGSSDKPGEQARLTALAGRLQALYGDVNNVEYYVGLFAERVEKNGPLPELVSSMVAMDAFSQALTNPLLSEHVWGDEANKRLAFTTEGIAEMNSIAGLMIFCSRVLAIWLT